MGAAWPAINAIVISNMIAMLTISFRYWATRFFTACSAVGLYWISVIVDYNTIYAICKS